MNSLREIAYRLDPARWVRDVLGCGTGALAGGIAARAARRVHSGIDGAAEWQNDGGRLGDGACGGVYAGVTVSGRVPGPTSKCRSRPTRARGAVKVRRQADQ